jgi:hypothetical protein
MGDSLFSGERRDPAGSHDCLHDHNYAGYGGDLGVVALLAGLDRGAV